MKIQKTFTIDNDVWNSFNEISKSKSYNKSLLIENYMRDIVNLTKNPTNFVLYGDVEILKWKTKDGNIYSKNDIKE